MPGARLRLTHFAELVGTAIANLQARVELAASRARVVASSDDAPANRARPPRRCPAASHAHGPQLNLAQTALDTHSGEVAELLGEASDHARLAMEELRALVHGILPPELLHGGLRPAIHALARRSTVPMSTDVEVGRLAEPLEATAYFVVAEALTNVAKHAHAASATVMARVERDALRVEVRDDGVGGADPQGSGFVGLADRLAACGGRLVVESPSGHGTLVAATIPLGEDTQRRLRPTRRP